MNTAIKIIDEMLARIKKDPNETTEELANHSYYKDWFIDWLIIAKDRISSLPSLDIDSLPRYRPWDQDMEYDETCKAEWIHIDDLKELLQDTLELNQ